MFFPKEIYPPKVHQFAYVTDGACTEDDILSMEVIIMKVDYHHLTSVLCLNLQPCCLCGLMDYSISLFLFSPFSSGVELEFESFNPSGLAQHLHADGLSKGDCWSSHSPVPTGNICTDCRGKTAQLIALKSQYGVRLYLPQKAVIQLTLYSARVMSCSVKAWHGFVFDYTFSKLLAVYECILQSPFLGLSCENRL